MSQEGFSGEEDDPKKNEPRKNVPVLRNFLHLDLGLFQSIDLIKDLLQRFCIGGTEIRTTSHAGDILQTLFIELDRNLPVDGTAEAVDKREGRIATAARTNGVYLNPQSLGGLRGGQGSDTAAVVIPIGEQDN